MGDQIKVRGGTVHKTDNGFVISDCGGWLAGVYDSIESAKVGIKNRSKNNWSYLGLLRDRVNIDLSRNITVEDFENDH